MEILTLYLLFVFCRYTWRKCSRFRKRRRKRKAAQLQIRAVKELSPAQIRAEQARTERAEQAEQDLIFYSDRLDAIVRMHRDAEIILEAAQKEVDTDIELNKYGAVVSIKTAQRHIRERNRAQKEVMQLLQQILLSTCSTACVLRTAGTLCGS